MILGTSFMNKQERPFVNDSTSSRPTKRMAMNLNVWQSNGSSSKQIASSVPIKSGWLTKEGGIFRNWRRRWFVLRSNHILYYYSSDDEKDLKGEINLNNCFVKESFYKEKPNCFMIYSKNYTRTYHIHADHHEDMTVWIKTLRHHSLYDIAKNIPSLKCVMIGPSEVGKSALIRRWAQGYFQASYIKSKSTLITSIKFITEDETVIFFEVWDVPGSLDIQNLDENIIENAHCVVVVYDVTDMETFKVALEWISLIPVIFKQENVFTVLLGTKCDLEKRQVRRIAAKYQAALWGIEAMEATALSSIGDNCLTFIIDLLARRGIVSKLKEQITDSSKSK